MADISAKDVAALRKITGAGMMDCKKALLENDGDFERAKDWLREKGIAGAAKREGRAADQGAIEVLVTGDVGAVVELNCETDFVAKGEAFGTALGALTRLVVDEGGADRRGRARARDLRGADPRRGQARAGVAQDRRGQAERLLQDGRARRTVVRQGQQADDRRGREVARR